MQPRQRLAYRVTSPTEEARPHCENNGGRAFPCHWVYWLAGIRKPTFQVRVKCRRLSKAWKRVASSGVS